MDITSDLVKGGAFTSVFGENEREESVGKLMSTGGRVKASIDQWEVFFTHCGWNSTTLTMCSGVPFICWPFFVEQQTN